MLEELRLGVITSAHGIKGEAKVYPTSDDLDNFKHIKECKLVSEDGQHRIVTHLETSRKNKNMLLCKFSNINSPEEVLKYRKYSIYVDRNKLPKLKSNENYIGDLIGLDVLDENKIKLGFVKDVFETGANHVMEVILDKTNKSVLFPYIKDCILDVNLEDNYILVHVLDGLLDI